jgi:hypothetical protein
MAADEARLPPGTATPRSRLRWLVLVVAVMAVLTAGWPLLNTLVADEQHLRAGAMLRVGPGGKDSASVRVGPEWELRPAETDPRQGYALRRGAALATISYDTVPQGYHAAQIWPGMRRLMLVSYPAASFSRPVAVTSGEGREGLTGTVTAPGLTGILTILVGPSGTFAISLMVVCPRSDAAAATAANALFLRSMRFPAAPR